MNSGNKGAYRKAGMLHKGLCLGLERVGFGPESRSGDPKMTVITCVEDLRRMAESRVPRMFYDYADSGAWTEGTYRANQDDFHHIKLRQRVAVNIERRTLATTMVGVPVSMPVA